MTKKQKKKDKKAAAAAAGAVSKDDAQNKKENDLDLLEDIKRDEDLYISESDVTNISNFIRTTNKSFNSLGNSVLAFFENRCSLAILHALIALFDVDGDDQEDVVRRLNIIYIVWRLPDMEQYMRLKPAKTIADVHAHPFATFLFWAEQLEQHEPEATLARIIVTCNVGVVEKLTALEFQKKAKSLDLHKVERDAFEKWAELNMDHWPEITEEMVPLVKAMRELGIYRERKDYEAGMAEAFYPLVHNAPTLLPSRMRPDDLEDPSVANFRRMIDPKHEEAEQVVYSKSAGPDMQKELLKAFEDLETTVVEYQSEIFSGMTQPELDEAQRQIEFTGRMVESSASSECPTEIDSEDSEIEAESEFKAMTQMTYADDDKIIEGCVDRVLEGIGLTTSKSDRLIQFVKYGAQSHPQFKRLLAASEDDEFVQKFCRNNNRICASFLVRTALNDKATGTEQCLFGRYMRILQSVGSIVQAFETVVKLGKEFEELNRLQASHRSIVMDYIRHVISVVETAENATDRAIRLVAMLIRKLITEKVVIVEELTTDVRPFCLKHNTNRDCTALYQIMSSIQQGVAPPADAVAVLADDDDDADLIVTTPPKLLTSSSRTTTTKSSDANSQTTVTTETKSVENAQQKMTMTTVVERSGDQIMQKKKMVLEYKQLTTDDEEPIPIDTAALSNINLAINAKNKGGFKAAAYQIFDQLANGTFGSPNRYQNNRKNSASSGILTSSSGGPSSTTTTTTHQMMLAIANTPNPRPGEMMVLTTSAPIRVASAPPGIGERDGETKHEQSSSSKTWNKNKKR
ncbi:hypothetical protein L3Y34_003015 [Caenorhabditis briggsae]|uniref:CCR4-NOT transcription complex subunit 11 n=2 Tax=Caenorhabditis briggsae TaxID=6238 RepID=A0AAE9D3M2_CAEBR|nr:hypothetical protein L3Y34_003015 [Caenorhabditis briggsae]